MAMNCLVGLKENITSKPEDNSRCRFSFQGRLYPVGCEIPSFALLSWATDRQRRRVYGIIIMCSVSPSI